jgi:Xaa-Pro aminopeptidase
LSGVATGPACKTSHETPRRDQAIGLYSYSRPCPRHSQNAGRRAEIAGRLAYNAAIPPAIRPAKPNANKEDAMDERTRHPIKITAEDINPRYNWGRHLPVLGTMGVDFEERVDYRRMHRYRLGRAQAALEASDLGALLLFDDNNIRYVTSTKIGEWARDKLSRWALLVRGGDPILWDFGSAAVHHRLYSPWLKPENCKAGLVGLRGTVDPAFGLMKRHAEEMASILKAAGVAKMPIGVDIIEPPMMFELEKAGLKIKDGQQVMLSAREVKSADEIALLNRAAAMVDGAYDVVNEMLRPGVRENDIVAEVNKFLYTHGSDDVEAVNAISGERCSPHPHNFTDRMIRPGDQAFFDILQSFMGYRTCYYRTFNVGRATPAQHDAYKMAREWLDNAMARIKPGASTAHICEVFPEANEFGFPDEMSAFGLQFAHGLGLNLHERPIISRVVSMDHPTEIKEGMVFAIETYCPATDGYSAARIEEEVVVTDKGCRVISLFPAEELPIAHRY